MLPKENIRAYNQRINEAVSGIRNNGGEILEEDIMDKLLTTLTSNYENKISILEETMQFSQDFKRETLISKIYAFEISRLKTEPKGETTFKALGHGKKSHISSNNEKEEFDEELGKIIAMIAKREKKGKGKYEGKLPFKCFSCNKIGHFSSKCPTRVNKFRSDYKPKYRKERYHAKQGVTDEDSGEDEIRLISLKDMKNLIEHMDIEDEKEMQELALISKEDIRTDWIIDNGCSHHMTGDKDRFFHLDKYKAGMVRFGDNTPKPIIG